MERRSEEYFPLLLPQQHKVQIPARLELPTRVSHAARPSVPREAHRMQPRGTGVLGTHDSGTIQVRMHVSVF